MNEAPKHHVAFLVTSNDHKFCEARRVLSKHGIATAMLKRIYAVEIQDDSIANIAKISAIDAVKKSNLPIVVEDAGLFIDVLLGFPGPYSSYIYGTIGNNGILRLLDKLPDRGAYFKSVVAFSSPKNTEPLCFIGEVRGIITEEKRGVHGFGFDPIFKPLGSSKTFGEMSVDEKNRLSHRALAFQKFAEWYTSNHRSQNS